MQGEKGYTVKPRKFFHYASGAIALALVLSSCAGSPSIDASTGASRAAYAPAKTGEIAIINTNDSHGAVLPTDGSGGLAERASFIASVRNEYPSVLLLDAGDINTGTALSNMFKGEIDVKAYNMMGYDAVAFGNHEFDRPLATLKAQMKLARFPFISANVRYRDGRYLGKPWIIKEYGDIRVGVFALTTRRTPVIARPDGSLEFADELEAAREAVKELRTNKGCDVVIALTHLGLVKEADGHVTSEDLAREVDGIDLIIDGHSHTFLDAPRIAGNTPIVTAGEFGKFEGKGIMKIKNGKVSSFEWKSVAINAKGSATYPPDPAVTAMIAPYRAKAEASLKEIIAETTAPFEFGDRLSRKKEIALGDMVTDGAMWYARSVLGKNADFAFTNGGGIRAELPAGRITREQIATVLPFDNWLYLAQMKGSDVIRLFEFIASIKQGAGAWAQVSAEARYTIDYTANAESGTLKGLTIGGKPVDPAATYTIVTNDYVLSGGDGYAIMKSAVEAYNTSTTLRDAIIAYAAAKKTLTPVTDGRITIVGGMSIP